MDESKISGDGINYVVVLANWSFEISEGILRNQKFLIGLDTFSNQHFIYMALFG